MFQFLLQNPYQFLHKFDVVFGGDFEIIEQKELLLSKRFLRRNVS